MADPRIGERLARLQNALNGADAARRGPILEAVAALLESVVPHESSGADSELDLTTTDILRATAVLLAAFAPDQFVKRGSTAIHTPIYEEVRVVINQINDEAAKQKKHNAAGQGA